MENLKIAYGEKNVTLNKGEQHMILTNEEVAFIVGFALRNILLKISIS